jgi:cysteine synthase
MAAVVPAVHEHMLRQLRRVVGNTPLLAIDFEIRGRRQTVYAKAEQYSYSGSIKDRMALYIIEHGYATGALRPGDTIAEATSGNTGIAFAALGRALGHPVAIFMPDWMSRERQDLLRSHGATLVPVNAAEGGFLGCIARAEELAAKRSDVFLPRQFANPANVTAHERSTGPELWHQLQTAGLVPDAFVAGVGTGGTVGGVGNYLKRRNAACRVHPVEPAESPTLSTGHKVGKHRIQGISDDFIPDIVHLDQLDAVIAVHDGDAIRMAQRLARELGLGVGISSGANFVGAVQALADLPDDAVVATVFADDNKKYLSTSLLQHEPAKPGYWSSEVELLALRTFRRACQTCPDLVECWPSGPGPWA